MKSRSMIYTAAVTMAFTLLLGSPLAQQQQHQSPQGTPAIKPSSTEPISLSVAVTDQQGQALAGLKQEDFKVYENGVEQTINSFGAGGSPISWGLILDRLDVDKKIMDDVYTATFHVIFGKADRDEAFLVAFDDRVEMLSDFISDYGRLLGALRPTRPGHRAALYDAVAFGLNHVRQGKNRKKALVVITDGGDDGSKITFRQLLERASREGIPTYIVGITESLSLKPPRSKGVDWQRELKKLAEATGAHAHFPNEMSQCEEAMKAMAEEVDRQYHLEYRSNNPARDGKWRKITVVVSRESEKNISRVVQTRAGYFAITGKR